MAPEQLCIWCQKRPGKSLEHIIPESLGCPTEFILSVGVCTICNGKNGKLDRALLRPFEIMTVLKGVPRKKGRKPKVDGFSSIASTYDENGPVFFINREKYSVEPPTGKRLGPTSKRDEIQNFAITDIQGNQTEVKFDQRLTFDRNAVRCLFKISLETIAFYEGLDAARETKFDSIRRFVCDGDGDFRVLMLTSGGLDYHLCNRFQDANGDTIVPVTILGLTFLCDFQSDFRCGKRLIAMANLMAVATWELPNV